MKKKTNLTKVTDSLKTKLGLASPPEPIHTMTVSGFPDKGWSWSVSYSGTEKENEKPAKSIDVAVDQAMKAYNEFQRKEQLAYQAARSAEYEAAREAQDAARRAKYPPLEPNTIVYIPATGWRGVPHVVVNDPGPGYNGARSVLIKRADRYGEGMYYRADRLELFKPQEDKATETYLTMAGD